MKLELRPVALRDLKEAFEFYEAQEIGVGKYFLTTLIPAINSLRHTAGIHPRYSPKYYKALTKHFPFAIYNKIKSDVVVVQAVLDTRRDPRVARNRLRR